MLPSSLAHEMLDHARGELPNEACGLLGGRLDRLEAGSFHPARNAERSPLRYNVHPDDLVRIVFGLEDAGEDLVGIFHSHTRTPAVPSRTDRRAAQYPEVVYVLATLADPDAAPSDALRAWRILGGESREIGLRLV